LPRQPLHGPQINHVASLFLGVGIGVTGYLNQRVEGVLWISMVTKRTISFSHLAKLTESIRTVADVPPHFLALNKKGIPVIHTRINAKQPAAGFVLGSGHQITPSALRMGALYTDGLR
jgi:hypothetical protein